MAVLVEGNWPVTGREAELTEIEQWTAAGVGALLVGEQGVGKSALLGAALIQAERAGARVVSDDRLAEHLRGPLPSPGRCRRFVVALDDVHLAAPETLDPVCRLAEGGQALLVTAPPGVPLPAGVRRLLTGRRLQRLRVGAFDRSGTVRVLAARLGGPVAVDTAERFWDLTHGNALVLRELVDQALADGTLRRTGGRWHWAGPAEVPGTRLADLADLLLGDLDADERELVHMVALARRLEAGLPIVDELAEAAESLNRRGVLVARRSGFRIHLRLTHPLCETVVRATLPELTARRLRQRIADAIEGTGARRSADAARTARLGLAAGRLPEPARLREGVESALRGEDHPLAERLSRAALTAGADGTMTALLGEALAGQRRHVEAEAQFAQAPRSAAVLRARALNMSLGLRRLAEAEAVAETDLAARAVVRLLKDRVAEAGELAEAAGHADALLALARHHAGDDEGALDVLSASRPALPGRDESTRLDHLWVTGWITLHARGLTEAGAVLGELRAQATSGGPRTRTYAALLEARVLRGAGRPAEAVELLRRAAAYDGPTEWLTTRSWRIAQLAGALAESGELLEAASVLEEARTAQREECPYPLMADATELEAALVAAYLGDRATASRQALEVAGRALPAGRHSQVRDALQLAARTGAARRAAALWRAARGETPAPGDVRLRYVMALSARDGDALDEVSRQWAALGLLPLAAEAAAQAARVHGAAGDRARARAARASRAEFVSRGGVEPPRWAEPAHRGEPGTGGTELTVREREIVTLAVSQLSNQEIADRLVLSVRTVENHLYRAYGKLGVTARRELAARLGMTRAPARHIA